MRPKVRCPNCKRADLLVREIGTVHMTFHQCADGLLRRVYEGDPVPETMRVEAECRGCGHEWKVRGTAVLENKSQNPDRRDRHLSAEACRIQEFD